MVKTKIFMMLALLLATSAEAGPKKDPHASQTTQEQAQDAAPNDRDLQEPVQVQQEQVAIPEEDIRFSYGRLDRILTKNLTGEVLGYLPFADCISLACSGPQIQNKLQNAAPPLFDTKTLSEKLSNAKPGMFREIYSEVMYEVPNIAALSKNAPHLHLRRMGPIVLDLKKLMNDGQALTPEVIERLKELGRPLAGPIELLQHKELWPQVCVLSLDVNRPDYPVHLLHPFAEQENRQLTFMMKYNVGQTREDELIRTDHPRDIRQERRQKRRVSIRETHQAFSRLIDEIEKLNLGLVRDLDCVYHTYATEFWSEQFSHLFEKNCFKDLRGYHCYFDLNLDRSSPLHILTHLPSSIESLSLPADFLLQSIAPILSYDQEVWPLINPNIPPEARTKRNIVNRLKQMQSLKEFNFYSISCLDQFYALRYLPKDILLRGKASFSGYDCNRLLVVVAVLNHFSCLDSRLEISLGSELLLRDGLGGSNNLIALAFKKHPLIKKDWRLSTPSLPWIDKRSYSKAFDPKNIFLEEVTHLYLKAFGYPCSKTDFSCLKNLKKLKLRFESETDGKMVKHFFQSYHQNCPKSICFKQGSVNLSVLADAVKALPVHIEELRLTLTNWDKVDILAGPFAHLQCLKAFSFDGKSIDPEAKEGVQKFFDSLSRLPSLRSLSFVISSKSSEVLKFMPRHTEKLEIAMNEWHTLKRFPEELFTLNNLKELYLTISLCNGESERDPMLDQFIASLGKMKSLKKVTIRHPEPDAPAPFLSKKALMGVEKVFIHDF